MTNLVSVVAAIVMTTTTNWNKSVSVEDWIHGTVWGNVVAVMDVGNHHFEPVLDAQILGYVWSNQVTGAVVSEMDRVVGEGR